MHVSSVSAVHAQCIGALCSHAITTRAQEQGFEGDVGSDWSRGPDLHSKYGVGRKVDIVAKRDFASAKWGTAVANELGHRSASVSSILMRIGHHCYECAFKVKEVVGGGIRLKGEGHAGQRCRDGICDLLNIVHIKSGSAPRRKGLGHND